MTSSQLDRWYELAQQLRIDSIRCTTEAGSGHPTSSMSAADLMSVLMSKYLHYHFEKPKLPNNDHFILSKGHAAPLLYSMYKAAGAISDDELLSLRKFGSRIEGHPVPLLPWVDVATGSLGQGLPIGVGVGLAGKYLDKLPYKIWVVMGDSETAEGSVWEAFNTASYYRLNNLIAIIDVNRLGQRGQTELGWNTQAYVDRAEAFGWHAIEIDGHNLEEIDRAYGEAVTIEDRPTVIIARTVKGKGFSEIENKNGWHGTALDPDMAQRAIAELGGERQISVEVPKPEDKKPASIDVKELELPVYGKEDTIATRQVYGEALKAIGGKRTDVVALDGEVSNSTHAQDFKEAHGDRFFEMFIAEQQLVGAAVGLQVRNYKPFASTFAAFLSRAYDFVRMTAISRGSIKLVGSHAGVSIGQDGPSQMALEDIASLRAVCDSIVLYPSDGNQTVKLIEQMVDLEGIVYLRTTRMKTPIIYSADETFPIGGSKVVHSSDDDAITIMGAGVTLHEAIKAYKRLKQEGITVRIIDLYSIKPIDVETISQAASDTEGKIIVVEDHWAEGGIGAAVLDALTSEDSTYTGAIQLTKLAVTKMPSSGAPEDMLQAAKINADAIFEAALSMVKQTVSV